MQAVTDLNDEQLDTPYRPEGWTVRQTVHHIADSHLNSYCRFKLALTEDVPTIRPYYEDRWAELKDSEMPIEVSMKIIEGVHARWANLLDSMSDEDFLKKIKSPGKRRVTLENFRAYDCTRTSTAHITKCASERLEELKIKLISEIFAFFAELCAFRDNYFS